MKGSITPLFTVPKDIMRECKKGTRRGNDRKYLKLTKSMNPQIQDVQCLPSRTNEKHPHQSTLW